MSKKSPKSIIDFGDEEIGIYIDEEGIKSVKIDELDLNNIHPYNIDDNKWGVKIIVLGKPGFGKTSLIESIMLYKSHICPVAQIFSGTETVNHYYKNKATDISIFNDLNIKAMEEFAKRQNIAKKYLPNPWAMQILDDVTDEPAILKKHPFGAYYKKGRHWNMIHIMAVQYAMDIPTGLRSCVDYIFILANSIKSEREKLYENFASGCIPTFQDFCDILDQLTEDHTALVIDNTSQSNKLHDRVFFYKADLSRVPPDFRVGCKEAHEFNEDRLDPNYNPPLL
jgi:GTPase SAR1 family protein